MTHKERKTKRNERHAKDKKCVEKAVKCVYKRAVVSCVRVPFILCVRVSQSAVYMSDASDMDSDCDTGENVDSGNVSSGEDDFPLDIDMNTKDHQNEPEEYPYEVLTTEEIVQHMIDCIKEVNTVVQVISLFFVCVFYR